MSPAGALAPFGQHAIHDHGCEDKEAQRHDDQDNYCGRRFHLLSLQEVPLIFEAGLAKSNLNLMRRPELICLKATAAQ
jgi:hypothetical protein